MDHTYLITYFFYRGLQSVYLVRVYTLLICCRPVGGKYITYTYFLILPLNEKEK